MANNKWIKWVVGLSSTALFAGFIGINANHTQTEQQVAGVAGAYTQDQSYGSDEWSQGDSDSGAGSGSGSGSGTDWQEDDNYDDWFQSGDDESSQWDFGRRCAGGTHAVVRQNAQPRILIGDILCIISGR